MDVQQQEAPHAAAVARALAIEQDRVIRAAARAHSYQEAWVYRLILRAYPRCGVTAQLWRDMAGWRGGADDRTLRRGAEAEGRRYADIEADRARIEAEARLARGEIPLPIEVPAPIVLAIVPEDEDDESGGGCACEACEYRHCEGECAQCEDHGCEQCWGGDHADHCDDHSCRHHYPEGCPDTTECCGWCEDCEAHTGDGRDEVCDKGTCHGCEHVCEENARPRRRRW